MHAPGTEGGGGLGVQTRPAFTVSLSPATKCNFSGLSQDVSLPGLTTVALCSVSVVPLLLETPKVRFRTDSAPGGAPVGARRTVCDRDRGTLHGLAREV